MRESNPNVQKYIRISYRQVILLYFVFSWKLYFLGDFELAAIFNVFGQRYVDLTLKYTIL